MKCVKKDEKIKRVTDKQAEKLVKEGWAYCPKHEWRSKQATPKIPVIIKM